LSTLILSINNKINPENTSQVDDSALQIQQETAGNGVFPGQFPLVPMNTKYLQNSNTLPYEFELEISDVFVQS
jgi:hypothetical protein